MADSSYGAPQGSGGGIGGFFADNPWAKWVGLGGVVLVAYVWYRNRQAAPAATLPEATSTTTGIPTNAFLNGSQDMTQIASTSNDINLWTAAAFKSLVGMKADPAQVEDALYRFLNGMTLTASQKHIVDEALRTIGMPPGGPFPIIGPAASPPPPAAQGPFLNPITWVWNQVGPATVAAGTGLLQNLGVLGNGQIKTPPLGSLIYARVKNAKGQYIWTRISNLAQFVNLPRGTQIAALRGTQVQAA